MTVNETFLILLSNRLRLQLLYQTLSP